MRIKIELINAALAKAKEINDIYKLGDLTGASPQKSVDLLKEIAIKYLGKNVSFLELDIDYEKSAVYSMCVIYDNRIDIVIAKGLNHCWKRFAICKEIFHAFLDEDKFRNLDMDAHTEAVSIQFPSDDAEAVISVAAEQLGTIAAMEFLFPYVQRSSIHKASSNLNYPDIAQKYRIPQIHVERYLSSNYMKALELTNALI
jgi:hypothetical protein